MGRTHENITKGVVSVVLTNSQIAQTFSEDGGFAPNEAIFDCIARIYDLVAYETELGKEVTENRVRGKTADDVAVLISEGTTRRRAKSV